MSFLVQTLSDNEGSTVSKVIQITTQNEWVRFQSLIQRGANLWVDAPPEIKEFADLVTNGKILQDYRSQNTDKKAKE